MLLCPHQSLHNGHHNQHPHQTKRPHQQRWKKDKEGIKQNGFYPANNAGRHRNSRQPIMIAGIALFQNRGQIHPRRRIHIIGTQQKDQTQSLGL